MNKPTESLSNREDFQAALQNGRLGDIYTLLESELGKQPSRETIHAMFAALEGDSHFADLHFLELERMPKHRLAGILTMLNFFPNFDSLMLWSNSSFKTSRVFAGHKTIKKLEFIRWRKLHDISTLASLKQLRALRFVEANSLIDLSPLVELPNFEYLALDVFRRELDLNVLAKSSLKKLHLRYYPHKALQAFSKLSGLEELWMKLSTELETIEQIGELKNLKDLQIEVASNVNDFSPIQKLEKLEKLWLSMLGGFKPKNLNLSFIRQMPQLQTLIVERMPKEVRELSFLESLPNLKVLHLNYLSNVQDIAPIGSLSSLKSLNFKNNTVLTDFSPLQKLPMLKELWLFGCQIKERGLAEPLKEMLPNCKIVY